jgi:elongation factor 1-alpha
MSILKNNIKLNKEKDNGYIEYKLHLCNIDDNKLKNRMTQMQYRLLEGNGKAIYIIGINDNGEFIGINKKQYKESIKNLKYLAEKNNSTINKIYEINNNNTFIGEFIINKKYYYKDNMIIAVIGDHNVGKTTLIAKLIKNENDDCKGYLSSLIHQHIHEIISGDTSSISHYSFLFDKNKNILENNFFNDVHDTSTNIFTFIDLCGKEKYKNTTLTAITNPFIDHVFILFNNHNIQKYINICNYLNLPFTLIQTKNDLYPTLTPSYLNNSNLPLTTSCKTSQGITDLQQYIYNMYNNFTIHNNFNSLNFIVYNSYKYDNIVIINGWLSGSIKINDKVYIGPYNNSFFPININKIYCDGKFLQQYNGKYFISLYTTTTINIKRGMLISSQPKSSFFIFNVKLNINDINDIILGREYLFYYRLTKQSAKVISILNDIITFKFLYYSIHIEHNTNIIFSHNNKIYNGLIFLP